MAENPTRVEAFSDGVFAIAITLLILEIRVPHVDHGLWNGLLALWPSYVAFLLSFVVILIMWVNHHELLRMVDGISYPFLFANGLLLLTVTFVPFPTAVLAAHLGTPEARTAVTFYCGMFVVNALCWNVLFATIVRGGLLHRDVRGGGGRAKGVLRRHGHIPDIDDRGVVSSDARIIAERRALDCVDSVVLSRRTTGGGRCLM